MRRLLTRFGLVPVTVARQFCRPTFGPLRQPNAWSPDEKNPVTLAPSPPHVAPGSSATTPCATTRPELAVSSKLHPPRADLDDDVPRRKQCACTIAEHDVRQPPVKEEKQQADGSHPAAIHPPSLPKSFETFDRAVAELLGSERSKEGDVSDLFDPRQEALQAFDLYTAKYDWYVQEKNLAAEGNRVPIACNFGASGSGKTSQLSLLCRHFRSLHKNAIIIYFTLNGKNSAAANVDSCETMDDRIALRILQGVIPASSTGTYGDFYNKLPKRKKEGEEKKDIPEGLLGHLPGLLRQLYGADLTAPILIAADELRMFDEEPPIGESSSVAVDALKVLARLSQNAAISAHLKVGGPVYIAASTMAAYDPAEGITAGSGRKVYYMPLPPLGLEHFEAKLLAKEPHDKAPTQRLSKDEAQRRKERVDRARTIRRMLLWLHQGNARALADYSDEKCDERPTTEKYQEALIAKGNAFLGCVKSAAAAADFDLIEFVRSLFFPLPFDPSTTKFDPEMHSALLGDAAGLCTLLRSTNPAMDSVYVHPVALSCLLSQEVLRKKGQTLPQATVDMLCKLCSKLEELPVFPTDGASPHGTGKLYEEVVTYGYASKALLLGKGLLRKSGTTVHEFLFGRQPPRGMPEDFIGYRRIADTPDLPIRQIARFPRASTFFKTQKEAKKAGVDAEKLNRYYGKFVYNAGCSALPAAPFVSILEDQYNVVIDSLLVLAAPDKKKPIAFGFQCKEYAASSNLQGALDGNRKKRVTHLTYSDSAGIVQPFLESVDFVQVFVTPNRPTGPSGPSPLWGPDWEVDFPRTTIKCYEALVTHDDIKAWSPMVGYSGCDVRVPKFPPKKP